MAVEKQPGYDWSARIRTTASEAMRYSRFVVVMKKVLSMVKPRRTGSDSKGNPFVISADMAVQDAKNPKKASLKNMEADLSMDKQGWLNARAKAGVVDMAAGHLE